MKQILVKKGQVIAEEVPVPQLDSKTLLVKVLYSCISAGTEMSGIKNSGTPLIKRALEQPENVKKVLEMVKDQGVLNAINKVKGKLDTGTPTGYSAAGVILEVGSNTHGFKVGDLVACVGAGIANHAEYITVPQNLCIKLPDGLNCREASTAALGAIAMQGLRRADLKFGEFLVIFGMGILGQLALQIAKNSGYRVIAIDLDERRLKVAQENGADLILNPAETNIVSEVTIYTDHYGTDAVLITAATSSNELLSQAFQMCKRKGRVVLVGVIGEQFERNDMYSKELDFLISTSYGPGRYDPEYEEHGVDYPYAYVRWTEKRNIEEYLRLIKDGKINLSKIIEREYDVNDAANAFEELKNSTDKPLIVLLKYDSAEILNEAPRNNLCNIEVNQAYAFSKEKINVAVIGAGGFAKGMHLPNLQRLKDQYNIYAIVSQTGSNAKAVAVQYNAKYATTDYQEVLADPNVDMVMICTRHNLHAQMSIEAMQKGKAVFVEKPMALNSTELEKVIQTWEETRVPFLVGFNRRFSKYAVEAKKYIEKRVNPLIINYRMNAGYLPLNHWVHSEEGGGRIIGEACHIFDLFNYFTDSEVETLTVNTINPKTENVSARDNAVISLQYKDGSICTLTYTALGSKNFSKEYCEIYFDEKVIVIDDYKTITGYGLKLNKISSEVSDKGQYEELIEFAKSIRENQLLITLDQLRDVANVTQISEQMICLQ